MYDICENKEKFHNIKHYWILNAKFYTNSTELSTLTSQEHLTSQQRPQCTNLALYGTQTV